MSYLLTLVIWRENGDRCVTLWKYRILRNFAKTFDRGNANKNTGQKKWLIHFCFKHFLSIRNENICCFFYICITEANLKLILLSEISSIVVVVVVVVVCISYPDVALPNISG